MLTISPKQFYKSPMSSREIEQKRSKYSTSALDLNNTYKKNQTSYTSHSSSSNSKISPVRNKKQLSLTLEKKSKKVKSDKSSTYTLRSRKLLHSHFTNLEEKEYQTVSPNTKTFFKISQRNKTVEKIYARKKKLIKKKNEIEGSSTLNSRFKAISHSSTEISDSSKVFEEGMVTKTASENINIANCFKTKKLPKPKTKKESSLSCDTFSINSNVNLSSANNRTSSKEFDSNEIDLANLSCDTFSINSNGNLSLANNKTTSKEFDSNEMELSENESVSISSSCFKAISPNSTGIRNSSKISEEVVATKTASERFNITNCSKTLKPKISNLSSGTSFLKSNVNLSLANNKTTSEKFDTKETELDENKSVSASSSRFKSCSHNSTEISSSSNVKTTNICEPFNKNSTKISNFSDNSVLVTNESLSEFFPDTTIDNTFSSLNSNKTFLQDTEKSANEITSPLNITKVKVPYSTKSKKHFCVFCKTLQTKLARHLLLKHKSEKEIKFISKLPKKHKDRVNIFNQLRKKGDFLHNTTKSLNTGILIVSRQQNAKAKNEADDYVCCRNCKGFFSKRTLRIHLRSCGEHKKNDRSNIITSRNLTQYIHEDANQILKTQIFPILRTDEITSAIRYDDLIIKYGNKMSEKYTLTHQHDMVRSHLRLLGRFKIAVIELCPDVEYLKEIFKPQMYNTCINALRKVANWDDTLMWFKTPAVAQSLTSLIKKCGYKQRTEYIKTQEEDLKKNVENFLLLWEEEVPTLINKKAYEDQTNCKRNKKIILPSKEDIKKLYTFLKNKIIKHIKLLEDKFFFQSWVELIKASLIFIQIFNRRRSGEIERLTISNYKNKEVITDNMEKDMLKNISEESLEFAKQFVRIIIRGKLGRTVSVLLNPLCITALDLIIKYREAAGIPSTNDYIFSKKSYSKLTKQYFRACPLLRQYSTECGAAFPESLRGTTLRKHIATYTSLLNIEEATVDRLANFMGHHKDIHKNVYRMSIPAAEITCVSKLLMNAICDENEEEDDELSSNSMAQDDENTSNYAVPVDDSESDDSSNAEVLPKKKRRSTSPYGKTKRSRWTSEEQQLVTSHFGCLRKLEKLPSLAECFEAIKKFPVLKTRTPQQVKSWIDNQRRYK